MTEEGINNKNKEMEVFYSLCENSNFPPIDLTKYEILKDTLNYIPEKIARLYKVIPIERFGPILIVAVSYPFDLLLIDNLRIITQMEIAPVLAPTDQILTSIDKYYSLLKEMEEDFESTKSFSEIISFKDTRFDLAEAEKISKDTEIINIVNRLIKNAIKSRASDIHIEPQEDCVRVRYRIDGVLYEVEKIKKEYKSALVVRIKLLSKLDITQRRIPQDGRIGFRIEDKDVDIRVSILPVIFGEKIVMRVLEKSNLKLEMESLGFSPYALELFNKAIFKPFGMILLTGPTGSGKTTTLYTMLNLLNSITRNIITIEDPVEYNLSGITQIPIRHEIGLTFATALRAVLRQSPDIIMVGEIRDLETADIAMKAALTGHLLFSTLHTNDAPSTITRLLNMGIEPFLISSSLSIVVAQRLVRRICPKCKISYKFDLSSYNEISEEYRKKDVILYRGEGCSDCGNTGYKGRLAIAEVLYLDEGIKDMIIKNVSISELTEYARKYCGMKTLREDALDKCFNGETSFEEVLRVTL